MSAPSPEGPRHAVVLAGRRQGADPLALATGAPHRALLEIEGEPMLLRVVERLLAWPTIEHVFVNIDAPDLAQDVPGLVRRRDEGALTLLESSPSPSQSVLESLDQAGLDRGPVLVTTADHALLDDAMLDAFFRASATQGADLCFGLVPRGVIERRFPTTKRTYLPFRDDRFSGANLFLFATPAACAAAHFWRRVEHERKRPWRLARAFGLGNLALFLVRGLTLDQAMRRASRVVGARIAAIPIPIAEAAVDVDKIEDLSLVQRILSERAADRARAT